MLTRAPLPQDLPGAYRVCLQTADAGADASARYASPDLLGHVYVGPYVAADPALCRVVVDEHGVAGYVLATADTDAFEDWRERVWLPPLREQYPPGCGSGDDARLVAMLHTPPRPPDEVSAGFPAHLHIDLLPRIQGQGRGRLLMEGLLKRLAERGVPGVHLGVDPANARARGFYELLGFTDLGHELMARAT